MTDANPPTGQPTVAVVGREAELRLLQAFLDDQSGRNCLILSGEQGIGKTALWEAGLDLAGQRGYQVLSARASEAETALSFAAVSDLFDEIGAADLSSLPSPQRRALEVTLRRAEPHGEPPDPFAISVGFLGALTTMKERAPLLIAIDDIQWLDPSSLGPLTFAARRLHNGARFLLTRRPDTRSHLERAWTPADLQLLEVTALKLGAIGQVLTDKLGIRLSRHALVRVHEGAQGNPLLALELGRLISEETAPMGRDLPLPDLAEDVFGPRIDHLSESMRRVLLAVSLSGGLTQAELVGVADPLAVEDAVAGGLVVIERLRVRPAHPMLAAAARKRASVEERRELHLELASAVSDPILKARHLSVVSSNADAGLADVAAAAADSAADYGRVWEAMELAAHALRLTPPEDGATSERVLTLARLQLRAGQLQMTTDLLTTRMNDLAPGRDRAVAHLLLSDARQSARLDAEQIERALSEAGADPVVQGLAFAKRALTGSILLVENLDEAGSWAGRAETAARSVDDVQVAERAAQATAWNRVLRGSPIDDLVSSSIGSLDDKNSLEESLVRPRGVRLAFRGQIEEANVLFNRARVLAEERGELVMLSAIQLQQCEVTLRAGHLLEAAELLDELEEMLLAAGLGGQVRESFIARLRALSGAVGGDPVEAARWADRVLEHRDAAGTPDNSRWDRLEAERALGLAALFERDYDRAVLRLESVWKHTRREHVDDPGAFPVAGDLMEALIEGGRIDEASAVADELRGLSTKQDHAWGFVTSRRGSALIELAGRGGYTDEGAASLAGTATSYGELGLHFDQARSLLALGVIQRRFNKRAAARSSLEQAADLFQHYGSTGWAERARDELRRVSGRRSGPDDQLTPTERRVAGMAADGLANKEIARRLSVSINTVEGHLSRAYVKLGVSSRGQLAQILRGPAQEQG